VKERLDRRVLGAIRWIDAVTLAPIAHPLKVSSNALRFTRNLSGLSVVTLADGLTAHTQTFDLNSLAPADQVPTESLSREGEVEDPTGTYLPTRFTLLLPRNPSPDFLPPDVNHPEPYRPDNSLFLPVDVSLLPSPTARVASGFAEVRIQISNPAGEPIRNALARVVSATDANDVLGYGLSDPRGETLVAIPKLKHFAPGATEAEVVSVVTDGRIEIVLPPAGQDIVDWTTLLTAPAAADGIDSVVLKLKPSGRYSRRYPFTT